MKGGESFGINNMSFGNIIIALNNYKFYIKLQYTNSDQEETPKSGIYYFVFDLKKNNMVTSFGLPDKILVDGNLDTNISKTSLDIGLNNGVLKLYLDGKAYKNTNNTITFNEDDGLNSNLQIFDSKTGPQYILTFVTAQEKEEKYWENKGPPNEFDLVEYRKCTQEELNDLKKKQQTLMTKYKTALKKEFSVKSVTVGLTAELIVHSQIHIFECMLYLLQPEVNSMDIEDLIAASEYASNVENFISTSSYETLKTNPLLSSREDHPSIYKATDNSPEVSHLASYLVFLKQSDNYNKAVLFKIAERLRLEENTGDRTAYWKKINKAKTDADKAANKAQTEAANKAQTEAANKAKTDAYEAAKTSLLTNLGKTEAGNLNEDEKIIALVYREATEYLYADKNKNPNQIFDKDFFNIVFNKTKQSITKNKIKTLSDLQNKPETLIPEISKNVLAAAAWAGKPELSTGGAGPGNGGIYIPNSIVILENNEDNVTDMAAFGEPIIHIKRNNKINNTLVTLYNKGEGEVPVFGYLTIGKQLMLILLDIQTNQRVSFKKQDTNYEKGKNYLTDQIAKNPGYTVILATFLLNGRYRRTCTTH